MSRYVVDASCIGPLVVPDEAENLLPVVRRTLEQGECSVPAHWSFEVGNLALMAIRRGRASAETVIANLRDLALLPIAVDEISSELAWSRSFALAREHELTVYDAAYLELAQRLSLTLLSMDRHLLAAAARAGISANPQP